MNDDSFVWAAVAAIFVIGLFLTVPGCQERSEKALNDCIQFTGGKVLECRVAHKGG